MEASSSTMSERTVPLRRGGAGTIVATLVAADGTAAHPWTAHLMAPGAPPRDLADAVHALCVLHGHHPGVIDLALAGSAPGPMRDWLSAAADGFARQRSALVNLTAAAGPLPSTPRQAEAEATAAAQRHAFEMLARSDRVGCALGAAAALVLDWTAAAAILAAAAMRFGHDDDEAFRLPPTAQIVETLDHLDGTPAVARAMTFGAQQVLAQHRGLWSLLEARAAARGDH